MAKRKHQNKWTRHHIMPSSRGGNGNPENIARVKQKDHDLFNQLFGSGNMTPDEIIIFLVEKFWNNQWQWVDIAEAKKR